MKTRSWTHGPRIAVTACLLLALAACSSGPVRRVSEPAARLQQLTVNADGSWTAQVRLENYSSIPMRFDSFDLALQADGQEAGALRASPALNIGPESADVVEARVLPAAAAKLAAADALAAGRSMPYALAGTVVATPDESTRPRTFDVERKSALSPAPGLPGVLR